MKPPNFVEYRRDLETSALPCLPYLGLIFQQLIHLHTGNSVYLTPSVLPKHCQKDQIKLNLPKNTDSEIKSLKYMSGDTSNNQENVINVWRLWKHYLILGYFVKRKENNTNL